MTDLFSVLPNRIYCCSAGDNLPVNGLGPGWAVISYGQPGTEAGYCKMKIIIKS